MPVLVTHFNVMCCSSCVLAERCLLTLVNVVDPEAIRI